MVVSYTYIAFDFHEKALIMAKSYRKLWMFGSSFALGAGIWILQYIVLLGLSTHFFLRAMVCGYSLIIPVSGSFYPFTLFHRMES